MKGDLGDGWFKPEAVYLPFFFLCGSIQSRLLKWNTMIYSGCGNIGLVIFIVLMNGLVMFKSFHQKHFFLFFLKNNKNCTEAPRPN